MIRSSREPGLSPNAGWGRIVLHADPGRGPDVVCDVGCGGLEGGEGLDPGGAVADHSDAFSGERGRGGGPGAGVDELAREGGQAGDVGFDGVRLRARGAD